MARVFVTGSADGLGRLAARRLVEAGHQVVLHARSEGRAREALRAVPNAQAALVGDLSSIEETRALARQALGEGPFDAVIHNAGIYLQPRRETADGLEQVFAVNVLAPYLLTALVPAGRLVYVSSGMHRGGDPDLSDLGWRRRRWSGSQAYSDSKLLLVALAFTVARRWPSVRANAVDPGWVPTKMGGPGAPDDLEQGARTQVWLAVSDDPAARASGRYFFHRRPRPAHAAASDERFQEELLRACAERSGVAFPAEPTGGAAGAVRGSAPAPRPR
jgi:NAD(P)-dependent dehydrogenase (short-subunit alcohol dehydrogenase family)